MPHLAPKWLSPEGKYDMAILVKNGKPRGAIYEEVHLITEDTNQQDPSLFPDRPYVFVVRGGDFKECCMRMFLPRLHRSWFKYDGCQGWDISLGPKCAGDIGQRLFGEQSLCIDDAFIAALNRLAGEQLYYRVKWSIE
jgi:hypothetical protein